MMKHQKSTDWIKSEQDLQSLLLKDHLTARSFATRLLCGADGDVSRWGISDPVWVYDNEPRNPDITRRIQSAIESKQTVVIWPSNIEEKDINDMYLAGHDVQNLVESNMYQGLKAKLQFNIWKRT